MVVGGVIAALIGAVVIALGAQFQNRGVQSMGDESGEHADSGFSLRQVVALIRTRVWLGGSGLLVLAILLQLVGLLLAPLPVVQPVGVLSLVVTALVSRRLSRARMQRRGIQGVVACVIGITVFVVTASFVTSSKPQGAAAATRVLVLAGAVLLVLLVAYLLARKRLPALAFALGGGICFGFVATLMKILLDRGAEATRHGGLISAITPFDLLILAGAGAAGLAGITLVQTAYASGSPDLVVAALTVLDPLVAVSLGIGLLGQAHGAPPWAFVIFALAEALAIFGVLRMARNPPKPLEDAAAAV